MSLDLEQVASPVQELAQHERSRENETRQRMERAVATASALDSRQIDILKNRIEASRGKVRWPAAGLREAICRGYPLPGHPEDFSVLAVDGSHIENDRNRSVQCYLFNFGEVRLDYGKTPSASLYSRAKLHWGKDLALESLRANESEEPVEGALLGARRSVEECQLLARMVEDLPGSQPVMALLDGSLVLFGVTGMRPFVKEELIDSGLIPALDRIRYVGQRRPVALASYVSLPRSTDVVNALRINLCKHETPDCSKYCFSRESTSECQEVGGFSDGELFQSILSPGERSPVFLSSASIVRNSYGEHQISFFYLNVGDEIARVESPVWVADSPALLDMAHSLCFDQCQRGLGYPVALSEAHEQAVVTTADRANFWALVERTMEQDDVGGRYSAKSRSKQSRWV